MEPLLQMIDVAKRYTKPSEVLLFQHLNFAIEEQSFTAVLGSSGQGKTTLLNVMAGVITPDEGRVLYKGIDSSKLREKELDNLRRENIGIVLQEPYAFAALTAKENLIVRAKQFQKKANEAEVDEMLKTFGLYEHQEHLPSKLSLGQRRRLSIAGCLLLKPDLILADEPTNDLDEAWCDITMNLFSQIALEKGKAVVMVTHDERYAARADTRCRLTDEGNLVCIV